MTCFPDVAFGRFLQTHEGRNIQAVPPILRDDYIRKVGISFGCPLNSLVHFVSFFLRLPLENKPLKAEKQKKMI